MIQLRRLRTQDAVRMLEWMHDPDTVAHMHANFAAMTEADCLRFIQAASKDRPGLHRAVVDEKDLYLGTVSLKAVDDITRSAEFAIAMHPATRGSGQAGEAMQAILHLGFAELGLKKIYWCVDVQNLRARHFYEKQGYLPRRREPDENGLLWYEISAR